MDTASPADRRVRAAPAGQLTDMPTPLGLSRAGRELNSGSITCTSTEGLRSQAPKFRRQKALQFYSFSGSGSKRFGVATSLPEGLRKTAPYTSQKDKQSSSACEKKNALPLSKRKKVEYSINKEPSLDVKVLCINKGMK